MARRTFKTSNAACRLLFFSAALPEAEVERYRQKLATCGLPSMTQQERARVEAGWPSKPAAGWPGLPPARLFVGCGKEDLLVDAVAAEELAAYCGTEAVLWEGLAHDVMLDAGWRTAADALLQWLRGFQAAPAE